MKVTQPCLTVIIPVYNSEKYLHECIDSIIKQTLKNIEIICVNDGSKDTSLKIIEEYSTQDPRIVIINKANGGLSSARNAGVKIATGEYIGFVDSDDWVDSDFYEKLFVIAKNNAADMAMANFVQFYDSGRESEKVSWIGEIINDIITDIVVDVSDRKKIINTNSVCNKLFSKSFLLKNKFLFYEGLFWEDNPFTIMTVIKANKTCIIRDSFYHNRKHSQSITGMASSDRKSFDIFLIMDKLKLFFDFEMPNLSEEYPYYFQELIYKFYFVHLNSRIHPVYEKEYFLKVQKEFKKIYFEESVFLKKQYLNIKIIRDYNYCFFFVIFGIKKRIVRFLQLLLRR